MWFATICMGIIFIVFLVLLYALLSANHDEEEALDHLEWVNDVYKFGDRDDD